MSTSRDITTHPGGDKSKIQVPLNCTMDVNLFPTVSQAVQPQLERRICLAIQIKIRISNVGSLILFYLSAYIISFSSYIYFFPFGFWFCLFHLTQKHWNTQIPENKLQSPYTSGNLRQEVAEGKRVAQTKKNHTDVARRGKETQDYYCMIDHIILCCWNTSWGFCWEDYFKVFITWIICIKTYTQVHAQMLLRSPECNLCLQSRCNMIL